MFSDLHPAVHRPPLLLCSLVHFLPAHRKERGNVEEVEEEVMLTSVKLIHMVVPDV